VGFGNPAIARAQRTHHHRLMRLASATLALLLSACAYTGHEFRSAGAGGTAEQDRPRRAAPVEADAQAPQPPLRPPQAVVR
jgi:hypothetical protein